MVPWPVLIGREELLPRDESSPGTEASTVTVATLSRDLLEASSQNQHNLECPQLTDTTSESDNEINQPVFRENVAPQSGDLSRSISVSLTDDDLSTDAAIPPPTVSSHNVLPDPDLPQGSSMNSPQSDSRMDTPALSPIEPTNQHTLCVIRLLVTDLSTDYHYPYTVTGCRRPYQALRYCLFMRAALARNLRTWNWTQAMKIHYLSATLKMPRL